MVAPGTALYERWNTLECYCFSMLTHIISVSLTPIITSVHWMGLNFTDKAVHLCV